MDYYGKEKSFFIFFCKEILAYDFISFDSNAPQLSRFHPFSV